MRVRHVIPFAHDLIVPDHWDIPLQGGICRLIEKEGTVRFLEVIFQGQPIERAPKIIDSDEEGVQQIKIEDSTLRFARIQLDDAITFLKAQFNVDLNWSSIETFFEPESESERDEIHVNHIKSDTYTPPAPMPFSLFAQAVICAETTRAPGFEATLSYTARKALQEGRYIDSFRYSFLLFESLYGDGKFRTEELKRAFRSQPEFRDSVKAGCCALSDIPINRRSDTLEAAKAKGIDDVINHIVDMRGVYFHGNLKRQKPWRAERQQEAEALAMLCSAIALHMCVKAAKPMYSEPVQERFRKYSINAGAHMTYKIVFQFRIPGESFARSGQLNIEMNGTRPNGAATIEILKCFLRNFEERAPMASLERAVCTTATSEETIFEFRSPTAETNRQ